MGTTHAAGVAGAIAGLVAGALLAGIIALTPLPAAYPLVVPKLAELAALGLGFGGAAVGIRLSRTASRTAILRTARQVVPDDYGLWSVVALSTCAIIAWVFGIGGLVHSAWLAPGPNTLLRVIWAAVMVPTAAWATGWLACIFTAGIGFHLAPPPSRAHAQDFDDAAFPPFLVPVPPELPDQADSASPD